MYLSSIAIDHAIKPSDLAASVIQLGENIILYNSFITSGFCGGMIS